MCVSLQEDNNPGTYPLQSERFYSALKGHGGRVRLVLLPHEGHGYRARESVLHTLYEQVGMMALLLLLHWLFPAGCRQDRFGAGRCCLSGG